MRFLSRACVLAMGCLFGAMSFAATPPIQPAEGPGSSGNTSMNVYKRALGEEGAVVYAFYSKDRTEPKPVVVFFHPWGGIQPKAYGGWIDQLARKGYLVIFPRYQEVNVTDSVNATKRAGELVTRALSDLKDEPFAQADLHRVAYIGHLAGAVVAVNLAAEPRDGVDGIVPKLVLAIMPGGIAKDEKSGGVPLTDLSKINPLINVVAMSADRAIAATDRAARRILAEAAQVPVERKLFIKVTSDGHGFPGLAASLASPGSFNDQYSQETIGQPPPKALAESEVMATPIPAGRGRKTPRAPRAPKPKLTRGMVVSGEQLMIARQVENNGIDALDYYAYWKTFEMLANIAFSGGEVALLYNDPAFVGMGIWSDGFPVKRLWVEVPSYPSVAADNSK